MRYAIILSTILLGAALPANAQVTITFGVPSQSIGYNMATYPDFQRVPSYPVYYAPQANYNLFFYDGMYWTYHKDNWYASSWYNGPWGRVAPRYVPNYILRVPVRYYRRPPQYFQGWTYDAPPRWDQYYGNQWVQERRGWDTWNRNSAPPPAPLPIYQRQYSGDRYPRYEQQIVIRTQYYKYQPSEPVVRQAYVQEEAQAKKHPQQQPAQQPKQAAPQQQPQSQQQKHSEQQPQGQQHPQQQQPHAQPQQQGQHPQQKQGAPNGEAQAPGSGQENAPQGQGKGAAKGSKSGQGPDEDAGNVENNGQGHNE